MLLLSCECISALRKRSREKRLSHPDRHTCPFPVSVYYAAMILLWRLPLHWNTICFQLSPCFSSLKPSICQAKRTLPSLSHTHARTHTHRMSENISDRWGFKLIYSHNKRAQCFSNIVRDFTLSFVTFEMDFRQPLNCGHRWRNAEVNERLPACSSKDSWHILLELLLFYPVARKWRSVKHKYVLDHYFYCSSGFFFPPHCFWKTTVKN